MANVEGSYSSECYIHFLFPNSLHSPSRLVKLMLLPIGSSLLAAKVSKHCALVLLDTHLFVNRETASVVFMKIGLGL